MMSKRGEELEGQDIVEAEFACEEVGMRTLDEIAHRLGISDSQVQDIIDGLTDAKITPTWLDEEG
jgi:predicted ArsR family transcriptional regulator